jgi:hypothetical protein
VSTDKKRQNQTKKIGLDKMGLRKTTRRKRKLGAGRTKAQGVPAGLAAVRHKTAFKNLKQCKKCGNQPAAYGTDYCVTHGARVIAVVRGDYVPRIKASPMRTQTPTPPKDLTRLDVWDQIKLASVEQIKQAIDAFERRHEDAHAWYNVLKMYKYREKSTCPV